MARIPELRRKLKHARSGAAVDRCADEMFITQKCFESLCAEAEAELVSACASETESAVWSSAKNVTPSTVTEASFCHVAMDAA